MVYNGFDFSRYLRANPHRPIMPPTSIETEDVPGRAGTRLKKAKLGELVIPVDVELRAKRGDDIAEIRHKLAGALWSPVPAKLVLGDDPSRYHMAVVDGESELSTLWHTGEATINFKCPDPIAYGAERREPFTTKAEIFAGGNWPTAPIIEARPAKGSYYKVTNDDTGEFVQVNMTFTGAGDQLLVIDFEAQHCEVNGSSADPYVTYESSYFELQPGSNSLRASSGNATVSWRERWL